MSVRFDNAPLAEMIAELRWQPPNTAVQTAGGGITALHGIGDENLLIRFGGEIHQKNFRRIERLVPPGFPSFPFQPVMRYRSDNKNQESFLYQLGLGIFTANALPPYKSWEHASLLVEDGVKALINALNDGNQHANFNALSLRYINSFKRDIIGTRNAIQVIEEIFGFKIGFPDKIVSIQNNIEKISANLNFLINISEYSSLSLVMANGAVDGDDAFILDMTVSNTRIIEAEVGFVMSSFLEARNIIHETFLGLTDKVRAEMRPVEVDGNV